MGISVWQILILLAIVLLLFGTKKLRSAGADMGEAIKGFRHAVMDESGAGEALAAKRGTGDKDRSAA